MKVTRSELREKIMTILYQINIYRKDGMDYSLESVIKENDKFNNDFVREIVNGVLEHEKELDNMIDKYMKDWKISRLGNIDQAIFRMSAYELIFTDTPNIVSINEGVLLSKKYSDEKVTKMLNAVLDEILNNEVK
jgi:N utilization substance protein B